MSRILIIEDSPAIALLIRRRLEMAGHSVEVMPNGDQALEKLGQLETEAIPALVLADVMMPGELDGLATLRQIRGSYPDLPVVLVTGQELEPEQRQEADAVFSKPIEFEALLSTIRSLVPGDLHPDSRTLQPGSVKELDGPLGHVTIHFDE